MVFLNDSESLAAAPGLLHSAIMICLFDTTARLPVTTGVLGLEQHLANMMPPETPVIIESVQFCS